jgi:coenzyme F420-0:L-glutamate ligase / coenzyme F420-1:gamma-L-glutamate ligase
VAPALSLLAVPGIPPVAPGDDLVQILAAACEESGFEFADGDVVAIAQKIVSKSESRAVALSSVVASQRAIELAAKAEKSPQLVELILGESREVLRVVPGVIIVEHRLGFVLANAGIDVSNVDQSHGETALLLPLDPDASARRLREGLRERFSVNVAVLIIDSIGRAWRMGTVGTAIGVSGLPALLDLRGEPDLFGRPLMTSDLGYADEIAAAASLLMGQAAEGTPVAVLRGLTLDSTDEGIAPLLRPRAMDLFR